jgi:hypothetical protein
MTPVSNLRRRLLGSLATSSLLVVACGGETSTSSSASSGGSSSGASSSGASSSGASGTSGSTVTTPSATCRDGQSKERQCFAPNAIITKSSGYGGAPRDPDAAPPPAPTRDANQCVVIDEVMNGCCNSAVSGPIFERGECCYEFCAGSCCGRPLVVEGSVRIASPTPRADWAYAHPLPQLDDVTREALREDWTRDALLEHASIASFATFILELLALGAPADLVQDAQAAAGDEIEHARLTFAVASRYSITPLGPGRLDLAGVAPALDLAAAAAACVRDGCVNETIASAVAAAQAANAVDPELRATLERIADDEARHAELAWRFVQWALVTGDARVHEAVRKAFDAPVGCSIAGAPEGVDHDVWRANGRLLPSEHASLVRTVVDQILGPCREELARSTHTRLASESGPALERVVS